MQTPETPTLKSQRLDGAWLFVWRSALSHRTEVGVELQAFFSQEGGCPGAWVDVGLVDILWWVCKSDANRPTHRCQVSAGYLHGGVDAWDRVGLRCHGTRGGDPLDRCLSGPKPLLLTLCGAGSARMRAVSPAAAWLDSEDARRWRSQCLSAQRSSLEFVWF